MKRSHSKEVLNLVRTGQYRRSISCQQTKTIRRMNWHMKNRSSAVQDRWRKKGENKNAQREKTLCPEVYQQIVKH